VGHFGGPKGAKIHQEAPICFSSQVSTMAVLTAQKNQRKKLWKFWEIGFWKFSSRKKYRKIRQIFREGPIFICFER